MVYIDKLKDLRAKRQKLRSELHIIREQILMSESAYLKREHGIKVEFEHEVQRAIAQVARVKYSNAERRRVELEKVKNADIKLNEILGAIEQFKKLEKKLVCEDEIFKLEERYLFKEIELFITMKNFDSSKLRVGL
jgi:hypothetical protein